MRKLIVLIIEHSIVSRMEKYGEMTEFEKLCFHIEECLVARMRWAVLYKSVGHIPRKLKKQRRKEALKKEDEIKQIRLKINAMPIIPAGAAKEKVFEYLVNIYYLNRAEERADVQDTLLNVENAENVTENLAFLEQAAQKGDVAANLFLGVIYSEGVVENVDTQNQKALILMDWKKSDSYLEKAIGLGSILAYSVRGMYTFLHCCCLCSQDEENDFEKTMGAPVAQDFLDGEKFLLEFIALKDDKALEWTKKQKEFKKEFGD